MNNKISDVFKKFDKTKEDFNNEYDKLKFKLDKRRKEITNDYNNLKNKYEIKKQNLSKDYKKFIEKYEFKIEGRKIIWNKEREEVLRKDRKSAWDSLFSATVRELLSFPFIWIMLIPAFFLDLCLFIYQNTAIRLYKIPLAKRSDYIVYDRSHLAYLNWIQKIDCMYCSYFNGLMQYAVEVAGRTEKYWCPIKHATKKYGNHEWEEYFAEYGDPNQFSKVFGNIDDFEKK